MPLHHIPEPIPGDKASQELTDAVAAAIPDTRYDIVETPLAEHHELILTVLQDMVEGRLEFEGEVVRRVMLMFPPGSAKSTYASVVFPTWMMGIQPGIEIILTGYGDVICKRHGKRARQIVSSAHYHSVFKHGLNPQTKAADEWETETRSSYKSSGILSGITGFRCDGLIWDDLTKGRKEADSQTIRDDTHNAYIDDARSRKKPGAWEVGIGTRWHEDEIMGRILPEGYQGESGYLRCRDGNVWLVLCVAAECERDDDPLGREPGDMLWPEWFTDEYWRDKRVNPRSWASLYQQRPAPEEGIIFQRDWMKRHARLGAEDMNVYMCFDPAVTEAEDADETAIEVWGVDHHARAYKLDEWVQKVTMDVWIAQLVTMIGIWRPLAVVSEAGVIRRAAEPYILREMQRRGTFALFEWMTRSADKVAMSRPYQAMCAAGQVLFPEGEIGDKTIQELLQFPAAKADHRVDAGANLFLYLEKLWAANPPQPEVEEDPVLEHGFKISSIMPDRFPKKRSRWARR